MLRAVAIILSLLFFADYALAQGVNGKNINDQDEFFIIIKNHRFEPEIIEVPANKKIRIIVENQDKTIEEFESDDLKKEKLVGAGKKITITLNPLKQGEYKFYGDFHQATAKGKIIVK